MHSQPKNRFVSVSLPIGGKQETDGNQSGNGEETKADSLCRNGNGANPTDGNEGGFSGASRFQGFQPTHEEIRQARVYLAHVVQAPEGKFSTMDKITAIELDAILSGDL